MVHKITIEWNSYRDRYVGLCSCGVFKTKPSQDKRKVIRAAKAHCRAKNGEAS